MCFCKIFHNDKADYKLFHTNFNELLKNCLPQGNKKFIVFLMPIYTLCQTLRCLCRTAFIYYICCIYCKFCYCENPLASSLTICFISVYPRETVNEKLIPLGSHSMMVFLFHSKQEVKRIVPFFNLIIFLFLHTPCLFSTPSLTSPRHSLWEEKRYLEKDNETQSNLAVSSSLHHPGLVSEARITAASGLQRG